MRLQSGAFAQPVKQDASQRSHARNQSNEDPKPEKPMHQQSPWAADCDTHAGSNLTVAEPVRRNSRVSISVEGGSVPDGRGLDPSCSSVVSQKKQG